MGCSRWTSERRAKHSAAIRRWAPWTKSTGPRTAEGKEISKMNAWKHGQYSRQAFAFRAALRRNALTIKFLFQRQKEILRFQRNELLRQRREQAGEQKVIQKRIRKQIRTGLSLKSPLKGLYDRIHP